jgi:hypothetical protein
MNTLSLDYIEQVSRQGREISAFDKKILTEYRQKDEIHQTVYKFAADTLPEVFDGELYINTSQSWIPSLSIKPQNPKNHVLVDLYRQTVNLRVLGIGVGNYKLPRFLDSSKLVRLHNDILRDYKNALFLIAEAQNKEDAQKKHDDAIAETQKAFVPILQGFPHYIAQKIFYTDGTACLRIDLTVTPAQLAEIAEILSA